MSRTKEDWDNWFLGLAKYISSRSKDETKVGCVIVGRDKEVLSSGYNGLPRRLDDTVVARLVRPEKLFWFEHAERNAIYNSAKTGIPLDGSTAYSTLCPCMDCARGLVQSGITRVVTYTPDYEKYPLWASDFRKSQELFKECSVEVTYYD